MKSAQLLALCAAGVVSLALAASAAAAPLGLTGTVPAGSQLFVTDPDSTQIMLPSQLQIPADFFDTGSAPFSGVVRFSGVPLRTFGGLDTGDADTIVRRLEPAELPSIGSTDTVPLEIVALSLRSVEPIQVQVGSATQLWDVSVALSPSRKFAGSMTITRTSDTGGTFDSALPLIPRFTFTRVSDGAVRVLDVGLLPIPADLILQALTLQAHNVPWRDGDCPGSILRVPGLNDGFCPGVTPDGLKQLTLEQAQLARHGVYPAQPLQNHYKCYSVRATRRFAPRIVELRDQFAFERAEVRRPIRLCNPVQKDTTRIENPLAHLKCYSLKVLAEQPVSSQREFWVRNQFGTETITAGKAERLCLPARKQPSLRGDLDLLSDHFKCYQATGTFQERTVNLADQFGRERVRVVRPRLLCNPVAKDQGRVQHPLVHLVCYEIADRARFRTRLVRVRTQFGVERLRVLRPVELCVPSLKITKSAG